MKNSLLYLVIASVACSCNVTNLEPESNIASSNFWKNGRHAEMGITGVYQSFYLGPTNAPLYIKYLYWGEARADIYNAANVGQDAGIFIIPQNRITSSSSYVASWAEAYTAINRANNVLKFVPAIEDVLLTSTRKNEILGEALFLRALNYFYIVRAFGDVPLVTEPSVSLDQDFKTPRISKAVVLDTIVADLVKAEKILPVSYNTVPQTRGRATIGAAKALLTSVYLWRKEYQKCADKAKEVMDATTLYVLEPDYATIFRDNSRESIFEIQFDNATQNNNRYQEFFLPPRFGIQLLAPGDKLSKDAVNGYAANDKRKPSTIAITTTPIFNRANVAYVNKYAGAFGAAGTTSISDANQILLRLADVILMRAEALNELNTNKTEAIALVNRIRDRAFGTGIKLVAATTTQDELRKIILQERYLELAFEGHRWFDLVRTEQVDDVLGAQFPELLDSKRWLFPVLESSINANPNLVQNPGWQ